MGVLLYVSKRFAISIAILFIASFVVYAGVRATVDPTASINSKDPAAKQRLRDELHLNDSLVSQYKRWIGHAVRGDLGVGDRDHEKVTTKIGRGLSKTIELIAWGILVAICFGVTFGVVAAIKRNGPTDYALSGFSYLGVALPTFWFAYILIEVFSIKIPELLGQSNPWFFIDGNVAGHLGQGANGAWSLDSIVDYFRHLAMPITVLAIQLIASWSRYQRSSMVEALQSDYIRTAHAKGMSRKRVYFRHALRNAQLPMVTVIALDIGALFQGLIITEVIFGIPGMSRVFISALQLGDATTIVGWVMTTAVFVIVANLIADLILPIIDPRIRTQ